MAKVKCKCGNTITDYKQGQHKLCAKCRRAQQRDRPSKTQRAGTHHSKAKSSAAKPKSPPTNPSSSSSKSKSAKPKSSKSPASSKPKSSKSPASSKSSASSKPKSSKSSASSKPKSSKSPASSKSSASSKPKSSKSPASSKPKSSKSPASSKSKNSVGAGSSPNAVAKHKVLQATQTRPRSPLAKNKPLKNASRAQATTRKKGFKSAKKSNSKSTSTKRRPQTKSQGYRIGTFMLYLSLVVVLCLGGGYLWHSGWLQQCYHRLCSSQSSPAVVAPPPAVTSRPTFHSHPPSSTHSSTNHHPVSHRPVTVHRPSATYHPQVVTYRTTMIPWFPALKIRLDRLARDCPRVQKAIWGSAASIALGKTRSHLIFMQNYPARIRKLDEMIARLQRQGKNLDAMIRQKEKTVVSLGGKENLQALKNYVQGRPLRLNLSSYLPQLDRSLTALEAEIPSGKVGKTNLRQIASCLKQIHREFEARYQPIYSMLTHFSM